MAQHEPLEKKFELSENELEFWRTSIRKGGEYRQTELIRASYTPRPTSPKETIYNGVIKMEKMHDGEPKIVYDILVKKYPGFFDTLPHRGDMTERKARAAIGRAMKYFVKAGDVLYGKPGSRNKEAEEYDLGLPELA